MLSAMVRFSVSHRGLVIVAWLGILVWAVLARHSLAIDAMPDVTNTQVNVISSGEGLSPAEVEQYLTIPVEMAMNGLPRLTQIRSVSRAAVSLVTLVFADGTDLWFARQTVSERLQEAAALFPSRYPAPSMAPVSTALGEIVQFYLSSNSRDATELRTIMDWDVSLALRSVPGVIEVNVMGGAVKEFQVVADPRRLAKYAITLPEIASALRRNNLNVGSGYLQKDLRSLTIRGEAQLRNVDDIGSVVVATRQSGTPILVRHIADVREGQALPFGAVTKYGEGEIVAGTVMMLVGENTKDVAERVKAKIGEVQKTLPDDVQVHVYYDRTEFIGRMLHTVFTNLLEGAVLVAVVLLVMLGSLRAAIIASLAIPFSMALCTLLMQAFDLSGNLMSLGALDFGLLTDGAVVLLEASMAALVGRRVQQREVATEVGHAMAHGAREVAFSLSIILLVYLPLTTLQGSEGRMFRPMAITVAFALAAALLYSLTAVPAMASFALRGDAAPSAFFARLTQCYGGALLSVLRRPWRYIGGASAALALAALLASGLGAEFVPRLEEGELVLDVRRPPSIGLDAAKALGLEVEAVVATFPEVRSVVTKTGRAEVATNPAGPDQADVIIKLCDKSSWQTAHDLDGLGGAIKDAILAQVPATSVAISQPIEDTINTLLVGSRADVAIKMFGEDLSVLRKTGEALAAQIQPLPGVGDLRVEEVLGLPLLEVRPNRARLARYGLDAQEVLDVVEASRLGQYVGQVFDGARRFALKLLMPPAQETVESFGELRVGAFEGQSMPLAAVAEITESEGPASILREDMDRRVLVEINVRGRDLVGFVSDAQKAAANVTLPPGVTLRWGGQFENFNRAKARLLHVVPMALGVIFVMLFLLFGEARYAAVVFVTVPLASIGGIMALWIRGLPFSIPAAIGFVAVFGVSVLNGVVMASHVRTLARSAPWQQAVVLGAQRALRAVCTTALVAAIGFVPLAISTHAGAEVQRPLATVVIGGIVSSTLLGLAVLPALLAWAVRFGHAAPTRLGDGAQ